MLLLKFLGNLKCDHHSPPYMIYHIFLSELQLGWTVFHLRTGLATKWQSHVGHSLLGTIKGDGGLSRSSDGVCFLSSDGGWHGASQRHNPGVRVSAADWSTLIGRGPILLCSHWSRASPVILAQAILWHKQPARASSLVFYGIRIVGFPAG